MPRCDAAYKLSNTQSTLWGLILRKVQEHWGWVVKKVLLIKNSKCQKRRKSETFLNQKLPIAKRRRFGNLGIGIGIGIGIVSCLYLMHFFLEKIEYHVQYASVFFLVQLVVSYLKIFALFEIRVFVFSCWNMHIEKRF